MPIILPAATVAFLLAPLPETPAPGIGAPLERVRELRVIEVAPDPDGMPSPFDRPGLELRFGLALPEGVTLVDLREPEAIDATDSAGTDLADVEANIFGRREYIDLITEWQGPTKGFEMKLGLPARTATSFTVRTRLEAVTSTGTRTATVTPTADWAPAPEGLFDPDVPVTIRATHADDTLQVTFRPAAVRDRIESVVVLSGTQELESMGTMWTDSEASHLFTGDPADGWSARITVRTGVATVPLTIELVDHPLP
ncbi:MAG: hypothetical protein ACYTG1_02120 [Planctomycetota bacterium]|jgi:hypothetical protein